MMRMLCATLALVCFLTTAEARPADCYGIPWCGCWLRHQLGVSDKRFNVAHYWMHYRNASAARAGAVGVMKRRHVGLVVGTCSRGVLLQSGNTWGRGVVSGVGTTCYPLSAFMGFRA